MSHNRFSNLLPWNYSNEKYMDIYLRVKFNDILKGEKDSLYYDYDDIVDFEFRRCPLCQSMYPWDHYRNYEPWGIQACFDKFHRLEY